MGESVHFPWDSSQVAVLWFFRVKVEDTLHQFEADMRGMRVQFTRIRKRTCFMGSVMLWPSGCGLRKSILMKQQIIHMKFGEPCLYVTPTASVPLLQEIYTDMCGCVCRGIECN